MTRSSGAALLAQETRCVSAFNLLAFLEISFVLMLRAGDAWSGPGHPGALCLFIMSVDWRVLNAVYSNGNQ